MDHYFDYFNFLHVEAVFLMIKKIFLSIASLFLVWQSYDILSNIHHLETDSWVLLLFVAWVINMFITGIFAFSGFAFPTQKLLPKAYYRITHPKKLKKAYLFLKVDTFRKFLLATLWRNQNQRGINHFEVQSMKSEFGHLLPFFILIVISMYLSGIGLYMLGFFTFLINWIGNLYPILLQRHHRMRIQGVRKRQERNKTIKAS